MELTEKGSGLLKKCMEEHKVKINGMLSILDETDKKKLLAAMENFTSVLEDVSNKMEKKMIKKNAPDHTGCRIICVRALGFGHKP